MTRADGAAAVPDRGARRRVVLVTLIAIALDQSAAAIATPASGAVAATLRLAPETAALVTIVFDAAYVAAIVASLWGIERFGKRAYFAASLAGYAAASLACAAAPDPGTLLVARAAAGLALGGVFSSGLLTLVGASLKSDLPFAMALFSLVTLGAPTLGPAYAGWFLEHASWRVAFAVLAVPAFVAAAAAWLWVKDVAAPVSRRFDAATFAALLLAVGGFQAIANGAAFGRGGWGPELVVAGIVAAASAAVFVARELRFSTAPFLDLRVAREGTIARGLVAGVLFGTLVQIAGVEANYLGAVLHLGAAATRTPTLDRCAGIVLGVVGVTFLTRRGFAATRLMCGGAFVIALAAVGQAIAIAGASGPAALGALDAAQTAAFAFVVAPLAATLFGAVERARFASLAVLFKISALVGSTLALAFVAIALDASAGRVSATLAFAGIFGAAAVTALVTAAVAATVR